MSVSGNGFLPWHVEVAVENGQAAAVKAIVKGWQADCRAQAGWPGFPRTLSAALEAIPAVRKVVGEEPQSAVLIPLRMVHGMTGQGCRMSATLGTGPIADAVAHHCTTAGIELHTCRRVEDADSPIELRIRDGDGTSESTTLYPASRARYRPPSVASDFAPEHLVLNRYNAGLHRLAARVFAAGGIVSFRPREFGRFDRVDDALKLLPMVSQLVLSSRHGTMKRIAHSLGVCTVRNWPDSEAAMGGEAFKQLGDRLISRMPPNAELVLHRHRKGDSLFRRGSDQTRIVSAPEGFASESRAARLQGALLGLTLLQRRNRCDLLEAGRWSGVCNAAVELAWQGTRTRPWCYPNVNDVRMAAERHARP